MYAMPYRVLIERAAVPFPVVTVRDVCTTSLCGVGMQCGVCILSLWMVWLLCSRGICGFVVCAFYRVD